MWDIDGALWCGEGNGARHEVRHFNVLHRFTFDRSNIDPS